ncbi:MBL fold metallo-hydrolase [Patescibacteria group bacterium]|nr:MBL fold metallo-hydrolase [Patescibacteria group bacterium]
MKNETISPATLLQKLRGTNPPLLLDVRNNSDFQSWHIPGSENMTASDLEQKMSQLDKDREIVTICARGVSSKGSAELLSKNGYQTKVLEGGLKGWNTVYEIVEIKPVTLSYLEVFQVKRLGKGCLSYMVVLVDKKHAIVIDPSQHLIKYTDYLNEHNIKIVAVIDTHIHADHISAGRLLAEQESATYLLPKKSAVSFPFQSLEDSLRGIVGVETQIIETPGHTNESVCIVLDKSFLFTSDTLFVESVGRSDLGQEVAHNAKILFHSVIDEIFKFDDKLVVLPAHNQKTMLPGEGAYSAMLGDIKKKNDINKFNTDDEFASFIKEHPSPTPPNYSKIKEINKSGERSDNDLDELELGGNRCSVSL